MNGHNRMDCTGYPALFPPWHIAGGAFFTSGKESPCNSGDPGSIPGSRASPREEHGYPLQYSCLGNPMNRGAWWATVHGVTKKSDTTD